MPSHPLSVEACRQQHTQALRLLLGCISSLLLVPVIKPLFGMMARPFARAPGRLAEPGWAKSLDLHCNQS